MSENLTEMATLREKDTGIPLKLWISQKNANHGPRVKVIWGDVISQSLSVSIHRENPDVVAGNERDISQYHLKQIQKWIKLNYEPLIKYWKLEVSTDDVKKLLKKLPEPKGMTEDNDPDDLFHASTLGEETTGISGLKYIWIFVKIVEHGPRIKAQWGKDYKDSVEFTVHKSNPRVINGDESKLKEGLVSQIRQWIILNYDVLLDHWNDVLGSFDAIDELKKLPPNRMDSTMESGDAEFQKAMNLTSDMLKENFHLCLVCNGTGKTKADQPCKMCGAEWKSKSVSSVEETMTDGGSADNSASFFGFDKSWDL